MSKNQSGVYVKDKTYGWLPATLLSSNSDIAQVIAHVPSENDRSSPKFRKEERKVLLKEYDDKSLPLQNIDEGGNLVVAQDMCDLPSLHEVGDCNKWTTCS